MNQSLKKLKVYDIADSSIRCNVSDQGNRYASAVKVLAKPRFLNQGANSGRIVASVDSESVVHFVVLDYYSLTNDSVVILDRNEKFNDFLTAQKALPSKQAKPIVFYTPEYMGKLTRIRNTPALTKEGYLAFLRDVNKELSNPKNKKPVPDAAKTPDVQLKEYMYNLLSRPVYNGKIIPETLDAAYEKFKTDETVKKVVAPMKVNFMKKPEVKKV